tara:strand:+ start:6936 stop:8120 length:1185 start_codon:yes stop_codon:yes gene_type:complete
MSGQYSPKQFFRKVANKFLIDYIEQKGIDFDLDLYSIYDHEVDIIFRAFIKLDEATRRAMESDFQRIHALANDGGIVALTDEAREFDNFNFLETIHSICGLHNKAMWAYLDSPDYWQAASMFFQANSIPSASWKTIKGLPVLQSPFKETEIKLFSTAIGEYFFNKEGRGKRCKIEHYKRGRFDYFCAFPEDFAKSEIEWIRDTLQDLPHTMAFEIIFVYCQDECTLALYAKKNAKNICHLQRLFVENIIKAQLTNFIPVLENKTYDLEALVESNFNFVTAAESDIFSVQILQARSTCKLNPKSHLTIAECPNKNKNAVYEKLSELKLSDRYISEVSLKVSFIPRPNKTKQTRNFTITMPDKCTLGYFGDDLIIREMLIASGIEPQSVNLSLPCM